MRLRSQSYLSDNAFNTGNARRLSRSGWFAPLWVLPRAWCVTASLNAKGVPRYKTASLVRLHLGRLCSFQDGGVYACRMGDWVHLWFWENQPIRDFCEKHDLDFAGIQLVPESLCFPKFQDGAVIYRCIEGVEAQLWSEGRLLDTAWWPEMINEAEWQDWRQSAVASGGGLAALWPEMPPKESTSPELAGLTAPWASNLLGSAWRHGIKKIPFKSLYASLAGLLLVLAGYWGAQWLVLLQQQNAVESEIAELSILVEPVSTARSRALEHMQWATQLSALHRQLDVDDLLTALLPVLQKQQAALREIEFGGGEVRLVVVPVVGNELNIAELTRQMEQIPFFSSMHLLPASDGNVLHISAKTRLPSDQT